MQGILDTSPALLAPAELMAPELLLRDMLLWGRFCVICVLASQLATGTNLRPFESLPPRFSAALGNVEAACNSQDISSVFLSHYKSLSYPDSRAGQHQKSTRLTGINKKVRRERLCFLKFFFGEMSETLSQCSNEGCN